MQLAFMNTDRIQLLSKQSKPTTFYSLYKPKVQKKKKSIKGYKKTKIEKKIEEKVEKKNKKNVSLSVEMKEEKAPDEDQEEVKDISEVNQDVVVIHRVVPKYPELARKAGVECKVLVEIIINEEGKVASAKIVYVSKKGYDFEKNALKAIKKLWFEPIKQDKAPVKVKVIYPIDFVLLE